MAQLLLNEKHHLFVSGTINFSNVTSVYRQGLRFIADKKIQTIDFNQAKFEDSSILAVLVAWLRYARQLSMNIQYINLSSHLLEMAKLSHLDGILPIQPEVSCHG